MFTWILCPMHSKVMVPAAKTQCSSRFTITKCPCNDYSSKILRKMGKIQLAIDYTPQCVHFKKWLYSLSWLCNFSSFFKQKLWPVCTANFLLKCGGEVHFPPPLKVDSKSNDIPVSAVFFQSGLKGVHVDVGVKERPVSHVLHSQPEIYTMRGKNVGLPRETTAVHKLIISIVCFFFFLLSISVQWQS